MPAPVRLKQAHISAKQDRDADLLDLAVERARQIITASDSDIDAMLAQMSRLSLSRTIRGFQHMRRHSKYRELANQAMERLTRD